VVVIPSQPTQVATVITAPGSTPTTDIIALPQTAGADVMDWQPGHWDRNGSARSWVPGQYVPRPKPGAMWVPGRWEQQSEDVPYTWIAGHWS
jgi:hypothetical protein